MFLLTEYQPSSKGGTRSPPAKSKMATRGPQNYRWGLEKGPTQGYWTLWTFCKISLLGDRDHSFHESLKIPKWPPGGGAKWSSLLGFIYLHDRHGLLL